MKTGQCHSLVSFALIPFIIQGWWTVHGSEHKSQGLGDPSLRIGNAEEHRPSRQSRDLSADLTWSNRPYSHIKTLTSKVAWSWSTVPATRSIGPPELPTKPFSGVHYDNREKPLTRHLSDDYSLFRSDIDAEAESSEPPFSQTKTVSGVISQATDTPPSTASVSPNETIKEDMMQKNLQLSDVYSVRKLLLGHTSSKDAITNLINQYRNTSSSFRAQKYHPAVSLSVSKLQYAHPLSNFSTLNYNGSTLLHLLSKKTFRLNNTEAVKGGTAMISEGNDAIGTKNLKGFFGEGVRSTKGNARNMGAKGANPSVTSSKGVVKSSDAGAVKTDHTLSNHVDEPVPVTSPRQPGNGRDAPHWPLQRAKPVSKRSVNSEDIIVERIIDLDSSLPVDLNQQDINNDILLPVRELDILPVYDHSTHNSHSSNVETIDTGYDDYEEGGPQDDNIDTIVGDKGKDSSTISISPETLWESPLQPSSPEQTLAVSDADLEEALQRNGRKLVYAVLLPQSPSVSQPEKRARFGRRRTSRRRHMRTRSGTRREYKH